MRVRQAALSKSENIEAIAREALMARWDAGRAFRLDVPDRARASAERARTLEAQCPRDILDAVFGQVGELALLEVDLTATDAVERLAVARAESLRRRNARKQDTGEPRTDQWPNGSSS